jgi:hypothetical protein
LVLVISDPLWVSAHQRAAPPQPRGGRPALVGERSLEAISIGLHWPTTDALFANNVERKVSNPLAHLRAARSFLDRTRGAAIPDHCGVTVLQRCNRFAGLFSKSAIEESAAKPRPLFDPDRAVAALARST